MHRILSLVLDFHSYTGAIAFANAKYGQGAGVVMLDHVMCTGTEDKLTDCSNDGIGVASCAHKDDVGVRCLGQSKCYNK